VPPNSSDLALAGYLSQRVAEAGGERVQSIFLIGSRARGTPRADSDLDLVVFVELPADVPPWGPAETMAERRRLHPALGSPPVPTELWVRTTDRFAEARTVIGGVEHSVETEGVRLFWRPLAREPIVRRTPGQVRRELAAAWLEHAQTALEGTLAMEDPATRTPWSPGRPTSPQHAAQICVERAVTAILVLHQLPIDKAGGLKAKVERLRPRDAKLTAWLQTTINPKLRPSQCGHVVVSGILLRWLAEASMAPYVKPLQARIAKAGGLIRRD
jgi:predicted nucleotidyltransferase